MPPAIQVTARLATVEDVEYCADVQAVRHHRRKWLPSRGHQGDLSEEDSRAALNYLPIPCASEESLAPARSAFLEAGGQLDALGDWYLTRFLRANKDLKQALKQLRKTAAWRAKVGADEIRRRVREEGMQPCEWPRCPELRPLIVVLQTELDTFMGDAMLWLSFEHVFEPAKVLQVCTEAEWCAALQISTTRTPEHALADKSPTRLPTRAPHPLCARRPVTAGSRSAFTCSSTPRITQTDCQLSEVGWSAGRSSRTRTGWVPSTPRCRSSSGSSRPCRSLISTTPS